MSRETKNKKYKPARSLTTTITTAVLTLSVVILFASGILHLIFNIQAQQQSVSSQLQTNAQNAAGTVSSFISENIGVLSTTVALTDPNKLSPAEQTKIMQSLLVNRTAIRQMAFYDTDNNETAMYSRVQSSASTRITDLVTTDILEETQQGKDYIGSVYYDVRTHEPLFLMAVPATSAIGIFQGTLVAELNLISMFNPVNQLKVGNTGYAYVVDNHGTLIAYKDFDRALKGEDVGYITAVREFITNPSGAASKKALTYAGINGTTVLGTFVPLETPNWAVVTELPWQEAYQSSINLIVASGGILFILAAISAVAGVLISRRLAIPVIDLTNTATTIAAGNLKQRASVKGGLEIEALANAFNNMTDQIQDLVGGLEQRVSERTQALDKRSLELQNAAQIVREITNILDVDILLDRVTQLVRDRYGYYHTGIFLVDDNDEFAILKAAGGDAGQLMIASKHKLKIGETGIVGYVAKSGEARIALDVGTDAVHFQNPILPYTRSEMALPLKISNRVIGVLDIQSEKINAFDQSSVSVMEILTGQISINLERSRLIQDLQQNAAALDLTLQENTSRTWQNFLEQNRSYIGYRFDGVSIEALSEPIKSETGTNGNSLAIPIRLREQTIGTLNIQFQGTEIPQETLRVTEEAANRLALALENARLVQDTQRLALRERQINIISAQAQQSTDLNTLLQNTVRELGNTLGVPKTFIQVGLISSEIKTSESFHE
jgi:GAF domain-containing protein/HAMP domain-containing protein